MRTAIAYLRVSTRGQADEGNSLPEQERRVREYAERKGYTLIRVIVVAESARKPGRKGFEELITACTGANRPDAILFEEAARSTRNPWDQVALETLRESGVEIHLTRAGTILTKTTDAAILMMWRQQVVMAQYEIDKLSAEVRKGKQGAIAEGRWPNRAPVGLVSVREPGRRIRFVPDPVRAPLLTACAQRIIAGESLETVASWASGRGLRASPPRNPRAGTVAEPHRPIAPSELGAWLRHPVIAGYLPSGTWAQSKHVRPGAGPLTLTVAVNVEPAVPRETWDAMCAVLDGKAHGKGNADRTSVRPFAGVIRCGDCGRSVVADPKRSRHDPSRWYAYYRCGSRLPCGKVYVREEALSAQVTEILRGLRFPESILEPLRSHLKAEHESTRQANASAVAALQSEDRHLSDRLGKVGVACIDGVVSREEHARLTAEWRSRRAEIAASLDRLRSDDDAWIDRSVRLMSFARDAHRTWMVASPEERREELRLLFSAPITMRAGVLSAEFAPGFRELAEAARLETAQALEPQALAGASAGNAASPETPTRNRRKMNGIKHLPAVSGALIGGAESEGRYLKPWIAVAVALRAA